MRLSNAIAAFPPALVVDTPDGGKRWTRRPETGREQLYHFIFTLRMVMLELAQRPVGDKTTLSAHDIAHMLTQLPRWAMFIRSGDHVGVAYTNDTAQAVPTAEFAKRLATIREQTRAKYCKAVDNHSEDVLNMVLPAEPEDEPRSRWEEM